MGGSQSGSQLLFQNRDVGQRVVVGPSGTFAGNVGSGNDVNLMTQMVENEKAVKEHQRAVRQGEIVLGVLADVLQLTHDVVGKVTDCPRGERRQSRHDGGTLFAQQIFD